MKGEVIALASILVFFVAFLWTSQSGLHEWEGADAKAEGVIEEITGGSYTPWLQPLWEPPSSEIESLFFSLQAAIGGLIIGYFLGYYRRKAGEGN